MNQDQVNRDRLLERLDTNVNYLVEAHKKTMDEFMEHKKEDNTRFTSINKSLEDLNIADASFYGKIYGGSAVVGAIASILIKAILK